MCMPAATQTVRSGKNCANCQTGSARHFCSRHCLHGLRPHRALRQLGAVVVCIGNSRSNKSETLVGVSQADGNQLGNLRIFCKLLDCGKRNIAGWHVNMKHASQNQLNGAAFGTYHQVDAGKVTFEILVQLLGNKDHKRNGCKTKRQQQQVQRCGQRT